MCLLNRGLESKKWNCADNFIPIMFRREKKIRENRREGSMLNCQQQSSLAGLCMRVCSVAQSCPALCDPMDCSLPGSSVHGTSQARRLEAISSSRALPDPGIEPVSPALAGRFFTTEPPGKLRGIMSFSFLFFFCVALHSKFSPKGLYLFCN